MDNIQINVLRFFLMLNALPMDKKLEIICDPSCSDSIMEAVHNGMVDVTNGVVYNLYMYHSGVFTSEMVTPEITNAMNVVFNGDEWATKYNRPSLESIARTRRTELLGGRPILKLN